MEENITIGTETNIETGLTSQETRERAERGMSNVCADTASKSVGEIIRNNTLTLFNLINVCLLALVLATGRWRNVLFFVIVVINALVGVYQELKARITIEKMSSLRAFRPIVIRDGEEKTVEREELVLGDICVLKKGSTVPVAAEIVGDGVIEVDESSLTGESDHIVKQKGDMVTGGSLVMLGSAKARVTAVGADAYINRLIADAKAVKVKKSRWQREIQLIIKVGTICLAVIGPVLFATRFLLIRKMYETDWQTTLLRATTGVIGMVPQGLVLMTSAALTLGVILLARKRVLTQELPAIETLAQVDVLCLDKTGTLTMGTLKVVETVFYYSNKSEDYTRNALAALAVADDEQNATVQAVGKAFDCKPDWKVAGKTPFSSKAKWQAVEFEGHGTFILGAPDFVLPESAAETRAFCREAAEGGSRVVAFLHSPSPVKDGLLPEDREPLASVVMSDLVRPNAAEILEYFKEQGVDVRVISGDHPATVAHICEKAGLTGKCLDASALHEDQDELREAARDVKVFGRVTPNQKKQIVKALQEDGHVVAMTGDGVNDILALKQSDCGIAMAEGAEATQSVAQFVLLESDFAVLPDVVRQGRRVMNNINRVGGMFLVKTIWSILLSLAFSIALFPYPFTPNVLYVIDFLGIGLPSFLLTLEANYGPVKSGFIKNAVISALPGGLAVAISLTVMYSNARDFTGLPFEELFPHVPAQAALVTISVHLISQLLVSWPMTKWRGGVFALLLTAAVAFFALPPVLDLFGFYVLEWPEDYAYALQFAALGVGLTIVFRAIFRAAAKAFKWE